MLLLIFLVEHLVLVSTSLKNSHIHLVMFVCKSGSGHTLQVQCMKAKEV